MATVWEEVSQVVSFVVMAALELAPWFLLAVVLGVLVQHLNLDVLAKRAFARHGVVAVLTTAAVGALSPFCSFTVIPLISRLLRSGVPLSAVMAFWVASPAMDPEIFALSAAALGIDVATARLAGALLLSVGAGLVVLVLERRGLFAQPLRPSVARAEAAVARPVPVPATAGAPVDAPAASGAAPGTGVEAPDVAAAACDPDCAAPAEDPWADDDGTPWRTMIARNARLIDWRRFGRDVLRDARGLGGWLLLALVAMALVVRYVPTSLVSSLLGADGVAAIPLAAALGTPLYLNGVAAIPVVQGLLAQGMLPAAGVTFLLAGATTTVPAMVAVRSVVNGRVFAFYLGVAFLGSILVGLLVSPWL
ncbi:permease [Cellulomonas sp. SLBN-39]|uniref:permease n=1 Tax=Cellulomonas sp. SLBN-39 TaxID=2768446 RepID=UPI00114F16A9|nr:permease [Cellulomonas sp. SLBN-39]TQL03093.1 hypothetical protein FBY24_2184 [Cellulomonas sp. SLBN-39]